MTKFWPVMYKQKCWMTFSERLLKRADLAKRQDFFQFSLVSFIFFSRTREVPAANLDNEVTLRIEISPGRV